MQGLGFMGFRVAIFAGFQVQGVLLRQGMFGAVHFASKGSFRSGLR